MVKRRKKHKKYTNNKSLIREKSETEEKVFRNYKNKKSSKAQYKSFIHQSIKSSNLMIKRIFDVKEEKENKQNKIKKSSRKRRKRE